MVISNSQSIFKKSFLFVALIAIILKYGIYNLISTCLLYLFILSIGSIATLLLIIFFTLKSVKSYKHKNAYTPFLKEMTANIHTNIGDYSSNKIKTKIKGNTRTKTKKESQTRTNINNSYFVSSVPNFSVYSQSFVISREIELIVSLITRDFVASWYTHISSNDEFILRIKYLISYAIHVIINSTQSIDFIDLIAKKIIPLLNSHIHSFCDAESIVFKQSGILTDSIELEAEVASKYNNEKLHPAVSLISANVESAQKKWLSKKINSIMKNLLPPNEAQAPFINVLYREILSGSILYSIINKFTDPDTLNQLIYSQGSAALKDRKAIKKVRDALNKHSTAPKSLRIYAISKLMSQKSYEKVLKRINSLNSISDLRRLKHEYTILISRIIASSAPASASTSNSTPVSISTSPKDSVYINRLKSAKEIIDNKIGALTHTTNDNIISTPSYISDKSTSDSNNKNIATNFNSILYNPTSLSYFMEFMDRHSRIVLVQFWLVVEGFKNPLDDDESYEVLTVSDSNAKIDSTVSADIIYIFNTYFSEKLLIIPQPLKDSVYAFVESPLSLPLYLKARKSMFVAQGLVYEIMKATDFPEFLNSDIYLKYLASNEFSSQPTQSSSVTDKMETDYGNYAKEYAENAYSSKKAFSLSRACSPSSMEGFKSNIQTVQNPSLEQCDDNKHKTEYQNHSKSSNSNNDHKSNSNETISNNKQSGIEQDLLSMVDNENSVKPPFPNEHSSKNSISHSDLFGLDDTSLFRNSDLFGDNIIDEAQLDEDNISSDEESVPPNEEASLLDLKDFYHANPGDLMLKEAIVNLNEYIQHLYEQKTVLEPLIRKAELTNSLYEMRILKKSKSALEREIRFKELQRQLFIIQSNDNSLYEKSRITIPNLIINGKNGEEHVLYIIEIGKINDEGKVTTKWTVSRRYNQFLRLHKLLKAHFPVVSKLDFPKKSVLKFQKTFLEARKHSLEKYLQALLKFPQVCNSSEFRAFLSLKSSLNDKNLNYQKPTSKVSETILKNDSKLYSNGQLVDLISKDNQASFSTHDYVTSNSTDFPIEILDPKTLYSDDDGLQKILHQDEYEKTLIKSMCEMFVILFDLNWLKGRTSVMVLQQLLGGAIERKVRDQWKSLLSEDAMLSYIHTFSETLWPSDGKVKTKDQSTKPPIKKVEDVQLHKKGALAVLTSLMEEYTGSILGNASSNSASRKLFYVLQNRFLNRHLIYEILEIILDAVFPTVDDTFKQ